MNILKFVGKQNFNAAAQARKAVSSRAFGVVSKKEGLDNIKEERVGNYTVIDHTYDAIVVGAGGAGLRVRIANVAGCLRSC